MTIERAIELLERGSRFPDTPHTAQELDEACGLAVKALRAQQEQPNEPLTLEEIRAMDGQTIWIYLKLNGYIERATIYANRFCPCVESKYAASYYFEEYERRWLGFRRKPEQEGR